MVVFSWSTRGDRWVALLALVSKVGTRVDGQPMADVVLLYQASHVFRVRDSPFATHRYRVAGVPIS